MMMNEIYIPISLGELIDKISILEIKVNKLDTIKLNNCQKELSALTIILKELTVEIDHELINALSKLNKELWDIEDSIREQERRKTFGKEFIDLARSIYKKNDIRAAIKKEINEKYSSNFIEEKSYQRYS